MVEYLLAAAAGLVLVGILAVQFLVQSVSYGPRTRRAMLLLLVPAGLVAAAAALAIRPLLGRLLLGVAAGTACYLAAAAAAVFRWRQRKISGLIGDVGSLRRQVIRHQREVDRIFWQGQGDAQVAEPGRVPLRDDGEDGTLERFVREGSGARARLAQLAAWRSEFGRLGRSELRARARVLEAVAVDAPDAEQALALRAKLATLALVYRDRPEEPAARPGDAGHAPRLEEARRELARLQAQLGAVLQQRSTMRQRRLPLD